MQPKYKRVLLKLSGESLAGPEGHGIDFDTVLKICRPVKTCVLMGVQIGIVVGGGNFWRGRSSGKMDRTRADHMGMLATAINALGVADALEQLGVAVRVQTAISMQEVAALAIHFSQQTRPLLCARQRSTRTSSSKQRWSMVSTIRTPKSTRTRRSLIRLHSWMYSIRI